MDKTSICIGAKNGLKLSTLTCSVFFLAYGRPSATTHDIVQ